MEPMPNEERAERVALLEAKLAQLLGDETLERHWLQTPREIFRGRTPLETAQTEAGFQEVEALLLRVEHGVFS